MTKTHISHYLLGASLIAMASPVWAQVAPKPATTAATGADSDKIGDIVVTATRRAASVQSVPISVGVVSAEDFAKSNLKGIRDLQFLSPSVFVTTANGASIAIRGVGTTSTNNGGEQAVGLVVDGVVIGFVDDLGLDSLPDLNHVEVLRGPQGELFGKNASAGLISVTTNLPSLTGFSAKAHASYGELNDTSDNATVNVPITANLAARFTGYYVNRDGFVNDVLLHIKEGGASSFGGQGKILWEPTANLHILLNGDYRNARQDYNFLATWENFGQGYKTFAPGGLGQQALGIVAGPNNIEEADYKPSLRTTHSGGGSVQATYEFDGGPTLTSLSAYRLINRNVRSIIVSGAIPFEDQLLTYKGKQVSQEFRITSPANKRITYVGGLYYYNRSADATSLVAGPFGGQAAAAYGPGAEISNVGGEQYVHNVVRSAAAFGEATYHVSGALRIIGGGRVTNDNTNANTITKVVANVYAPPGGKIRPYGTGSANSTNFTGRAGLQYNFTANAMAYFTYSTGYKGAVIDSDSSNAVRYVAPETVKSLEAGIKSTLFDRHLILDISVFDEKFKNFQTSVWEPSLNGFILGNAGGLLSKGVEMNFTAKPVTGVTLSGGINYLDAHYTDFRASCYSSLAPIPQTFTTNPSGVAGCYIAPGSSSGFIQAAGFPAANASKLVFNLSAQYVHPIGHDLVLDSTVTYVRRSKFYNVGYDPNTKINGYGLVGLNIGVGPRNGAWRLGVFARNLLNTYFVASVASTSLDAGAYTNLVNPEARRTLGADVDVAF